MAVTASDATTTVIVKEDGPQGNPGTDGADGFGFNQVRSSLLKNPLLHLFKKNKLAEVSAPDGNDTDVTWSRSTTANYIDIYGDLKSAAINEPRQNKNGWLIEGSSTNLALHSEDLANAVYGSNGVTVTSATNSYGDLSVDTLTTTSSSSFLFQSVSGIDASSEYTFSIYVRAISGVISSDSVIIRVDGDVVSSNPMNVGLEINSDGLTKVSTTVASNSAPSNIIGVVASTYSGVEIEVGGFQIEKSPTPTSYIKTTTVQATRAADNVTCDFYENMPDLSDNFSFCVNVDLISNNVTSENRRIINTEDSSFFIQYLLGDVFAGNSTLQITKTQTEPYFSLCLSSENGVSKLYVDGVLVGTVSIPYDSVKSGSVYFAKSFVDTWYANCAISDLRVYDKALNQYEAKLIGGI